MYAVGALELADTFMSLIYAPLLIITREDILHTNTVLGVERGYYT